MTMAFLENLKQKFSDAWLRLSPADASSHFGEVFAQRVALFDYALKQGRAWLAPGK